MKILIKKIFYGIVWSIRKNRVYQAINKNLNDKQFMRGMLWGIWLWILTELIQDLLHIILVK